jgi:capsular exopolysaccharide synthesis family protein
MSKNYELMQEMERSRSVFSNGIVEPAPPISSDSPNKQVPQQLASDLTLGLVQRIFLQQTQESPRMVVFASVDHGNGCSQIAASVAKTLAGNAPGAVCLIEANFRSPTLSKTFGTTNYHGLTDALLEQGSIRSFMKPVCNESLWLLTSGPLVADSPNLLTSERMRVRAAELRREFDFVVVDAPPLTCYSDAIALGQLSDGIVLILEAESTRREAAIAATGSLRSSGVRIIAAVLNKRIFPIPKAIYSKL